jgi:hypothetical protein
MLDSPASPQAAKLRLTFATYIPSIQRIELALLASLPRKPHFKTELAAQSPLSPHLQFRHHQNRTFAVITIGGEKSFAFFGTSFLFCWRIDADPATIN